jgi:hypothetical protein
MAHGVRRDKYFGPKRLQGKFSGAEGALILGNFAHHQKKKAPGHPGAFYRHRIAG